MNSQAITTASHYDEEYFKYQSEIGRFGGWANLTKFSEYIRPEMKVLDFGCGGGYLLANISCKEKLGIEISQATVGKYMARRLDPPSPTWAELPAQSR